MTLGPALLIYTANHCSVDKLCRRKVVMYCVDNFLLRKLSGVNHRDRKLNAANHCLKAVSRTKVAVENNRIINEI